VSETALVVDLQTGSIRPVGEASLQEAGLLERRDLQRWISEHPELVEPDSLLVTSEFDRWELRDQRVEDRLDVLFLDRLGSLLIAELKRDRASDTTDLQALKYAAYCSTMTVDDVVEEYERFHGAKEDEARSQILAHAPAIEEDGLGPVRIRLVAGGFGPAVTSVVLWLRETKIDIGCVQVTARLLDGDSAMVTSRQLLPLPLAEDYLVRRRRREQEQEVRSRRSRAANTVQVLAQAGLIEEGTVLRLGLDTLVSRWRPYVERLLDEHPDAGVAEWNGSLTARSMRWRFDGDLYSLTGLTKRVLEEAGFDPPDAIAGPDHWLLPEGTPMYQAAVQQRESNEAQS
jgi:hypothetical protein